MAIRLESGNSGVGIFSTLTNAYCLVASEICERLYGSLQAKLADVIPVVKTSIGGACLVGCLTAGNKNGLLVPYTTTNQGYELAMKNQIDNELVHLTELLDLRLSLPDSVVVQRLEETLCGLGNCIACNDRVALVSPDVDQETEEMIADVLGVEPIRKTVAGNMNCALNNNGGLVHPHTSEDELEELRMLFEIPFEAGTVDGGSKLIAADLTVNDRIAFCGPLTTRRELSVIEDVFGLGGTQPQRTISVSGGRRRQLDMTVAEICKMDITAAEISLIENVLKLKPPSLMLRR